jgi:hypothetical protein
MEITLTQSEADALILLPAGSLLFSGHRLILSGGGFPRVFSSAGYRSRRIFCFGFDLPIGVAVAPALPSP